jgi:hypothetical protein
MDVRGHSEFFALTITRDTRVVIYAYNHHVRLLSPEPWFSTTTGVKITALVLNWGVENWVVRSGSRDFGVA